MNEIKFEYLIGDETKFKDATEIVLAIIQYGKNDFCWLTELEKIPEVEGKLIAMRRVIRTPVWTRADQKAGKLPEVGAKHCFAGLPGVFTCLFIDCAGYVWSFGENNEVYCSEDNALMAFESTEERQQRLREEWCNNATKLLKNLEYTSTLTSIYDALLSGELPMPSKGGE